MQFLPHFPYPQPRPIQEKALALLGENWDKYQVFCISAPTAFGKTGIAKTLMNACHSVSVITPNNLLVDQFLQEFPETRTLSRLDSYRCENLQQSCSSTRGMKQQFCKGCPASRDLATAKYKRGPGIYNYHTYLAHKLYRQVLVIDEAHNLIPILKGRFEKVIWQHEYKYPGNAFRPEQMLAWVQSLPQAKRRRQKIEILESCLTSPTPEYVPTRAKRPFNGKGTLRGQPEDRDCIVLTPVDISMVPPLFWPREVQKIVLLSATINHKDIEALGLNRKPILYLNCESPIAPQRRPISLDPCISLARGSMDTSLPKLVDYIENVAASHVGEKGVIHATYELSRRLEEHLRGDRYLFHSRTNKRDIYNAFRNSEPSRGQILIACGMYEGIDLPEDLGRWQIIAKVPWPSLGDAGVRYQTDKDPNWYIWETLKVFIQACGRICRTPTDNGSTICPDSSVQRLIREGESMLPLWFKEGIEEGRKYVS
jgi:Rad3-related DNA helicase